LHFNYGKDEKICTFEENTDIEKYINTIIPQKNNNPENYHITEDIKTLWARCNTLGKAKRYWLRSIALRDADEVLQIM